MTRSILGAATMAVFAAGLFASPTHTLFEAHHSTGFADNAGNGTSGASPNNGIDAPPYFVPVDPPKVDSNRSELPNLSMDLSFGDGPLDAGNFGNINRIYLNPSLSGFYGKDGQLTGVNHTDFSYKYASDVNTFFYVDAPVHIDSFVTDSVNPAPEPSALVLGIVGLAGIFIGRYRRRAKLIRRLTWWDEPLPQR